MEHSAVSLSYRPMVGTSVVIRAEWLWWAGQERGPLANLQAKNLGISWKIWFSSKKLATKKLFLSGRDRTLFLCLMLVWISYAFARHMSVNNLHQRTMAQKAGSPVQWRRQETERWWRPSPSPPICNRGPILQIAAVPGLTNVALSGVTRLRSQSAAAAEG